MHSDRARVLGSLAFAFFIGCSPSLYVPVAEDAGDGVSRDELVRGREVYVQKCGSCHTLYLPGTLPSAGWKSTFDEMTGRARLTDAEKHLVWKYLDVAIARGQRK